ncbi:type IV secretion protein Rhs [Vibrio campbellii]|uniref:RHS repeat-associated core domain-containing protein n=1 Tax=Vibrio campbellii TaxID=680 RepID=UPI00215C1906|nr:RHS repeat-associated core domain-containing protein [Vibrio campbellii]MCR9907036.1 type IV secretion protein Rhs [Vibrio campbellii]
MLKRSSLFACMGLTALFLSSPTLALVSGEGSTFALSGEYATSGGEATYSLPIALPKGRGEHTPTLSLDYQSDSPNGLMGMGWTLGGTSSIYRCGKNLDVDGNWGGVNFDDNDRYCLDGQRLIAVKGEAGKDLTEYRVEKNGYDKIVSFGQSGDNGPEYFKVWRTDGTVHEYGVTLDARVELPGQANVYKWARNRVTDLSKHNHIDYGYTERNAEGSHVLHTISYVGGQAALVWGTRDDGAYVFLNGSRLWKQERLHSIQIKGADNQVLGTYQFNYQYSPVTSRTLMQSVQYCSTGEQGCTTPVKFDWNTYGEAGPEQVYQREKAEIDFEHVHFFDDDRDGHKTPFGVVADHETLSWCTYSGSVNGFTGTMRDLAGAETEPGMEGFTLVGSLNTPELLPRPYEIDYNGACGPNGTYSKYKYEYNDDIPSARSYIPELDGVLVDYSDQSPSFFAADVNGDGKETLQPRPWDNKPAEVQVLDIDNDNIDDYVYLKDHKYYFVLSGNGHQAFTVDPTYTMDHRFIDLNNDGLLDWIVVRPTTSSSVDRTIDFYLYDGAQYVHDTSSISFPYDDAEPSLDKIKLIDINADGYPELYVNGTFYLNEAGEINYDKVVGEKLEDVDFAEDINGDGFLDLITRLENHEYNGHDRLFTHTSIPYAVDRISRIEEHDIEYQIDYQSSADQRVHTQKRYFDYPIVNATPSRYLVSQVRKQPRGYEPTTLLYHYEGAKSHELGRGFLGFETITEVEQADVVTTRVSHFHQVDLPIAGEPDSIEVYRQNAGSEPYSHTFGDLVTLTHYQYTTQEKGKTFQAYPSQVIKQVHDQGVVIKKETTTQTLNAFGSITSETVTTEDPSNPGDHFTTTVSNDYVSEGYTTTSHTLNTVTGGDVDNIDTEFSAYEQGLTAYCPTSADESVVYYRANDEFILLHGEVVTPILTNAHDAYYRYDVTGTATDPYNGVTYQQGALTTITEDEFNSQSLTECGAYTYIPSEEDQTPPTLGTTTSTVTELITENGNEYWQVSAIARSQSTTRHAASGLSKTIDLDYAYTSAGLVSKMTTGGGAYDVSSPSGRTLVNEYRYDGVGNLSTEIESGSELNARTTSYEYDSEGLNLLRTTNALGHVTTTHYDSVGRLVSSISPLKGRTTSYEYDAFHRVAKETLPGSNNVTTTDYQLGSACAYALPTSAYCVTTTTADGAQTLVHYDYAEREIREMHRAFDGQWVTVDSVWDRNGRKRSTTKPQFVKNAAPAPKVNFDYDLLNREVRRVEPASKGGLAVFSAVYDGHKMTVTDARGYKRSTTKNVMEHIVRKDEPLGAYQTYTYYPDGKLKSSADSAGNVTTTRYDNLGHRSYLDDPDAGQWTYRYNAAGELTYKQDANNVTTTIAYDALGRKVAQTEGGSTSTWRYDENQAPGTLSGFSGHGQQTDYYYNSAGLLQEQAVTIDGDIFSTQYTYDGFERIAREVRPDGRTLSDALGQPDNDRFAVEYIYNPYGYLSAVRSPRTYADDVFTSAKFREDIRRLLDDAIAQANDYLVTANRYASQSVLFEEKADYYSQQTVDVYNLDDTSATMLDQARYHQWCDSQDNCYLVPATWIMLHDDITVPLDIALDGDVYLITRDPSHSTTGIEHHDVTLTPISQEEFESLSLTQSDDMVVSGDYDGDGATDIMHQDDVYGARADSETREELLFTAQDLEEAAVIANTYYKLYTDLAEDLIDMAEQVAELSGLYCEYANALAGGHADESLRTQCLHDGSVSQADHLQTILTQSELEEEAGNPAYFYYWQRRDTDAYDHTVAETLGNGLANSYEYDASTGRPSVFVTHKASEVYHHQFGHANTPGRNLRYVSYQYDNHNNVTQRNDEALGITDQWTYDALDRVTSNTIALVDKTRHGVNNPDLTGPKTYQYDLLGNLTYQSDVGDYTYGHQAGPHAVTHSNGLNYTYDAVGNMLSAKTDSQTDPTTERTLAWSAFNKPTDIMRDGHTVTFAYDAEHKRYKKTSSDGTETVYVGNYYERVTDQATGDIQHKHFIYADGKLIALNTQTTDAQHELKNKQVRYLHYDSLGSIDLITDGYGLVVERRSYSTWGQQRAVTWQSGSAEEVIQAAITNRGYTGHEEIPEVNLIHMNGRVYDPELARFTSADPVIQDPYAVSSFNRYAYVWNNPLKYTDPTGFITSSETKGKEEGSEVGPQNGGGGETNGKSNETTDPKDKNETLNSVANTPEDDSEDKDSDYGLTDAVADFVPFGNTIKHTLQGEYSQAYDALKTESLEVGIGIATGGLGIVATRIYKATKIAKKASNIADTLNSTSRATKIGPRKGTFPDEVFTGKKPKQTTPGRKVVTQERYNPKTDKLEKSDITYDEYGRQEKRVDYTDHGYSDPAKDNYHSNPHSHTYDYGPGYGAGRETRTNIK